MVLSRYSIDFLISMKAGRFLVLVQGNTEDVIVRICVIPRLIIIISPLFVFHKILLQEIQR